jgi:microcompartment protein CcmL/EutN
MINSALGLVETRGYLSAVAAADAALKAAAVTCIGVEVIKGGLVTVKLDGDVGAVQAAVEAGAEKAKDLGTLVSRHVIARMHEETVALVTDTIGQKTIAEVAAAQLPATEAPMVDSELAEAKPVVEQPNVPEPVLADVAIPSTDKKEATPVQTKTAPKSKDSTAKTSKKKKKAGS